MLGAVIPIFPLNKFDYISEMYCFSSLIGVSLTTGTFVSQRLIFIKTKILAKIKAFLPLIKF